MSRKRDEGTQNRVREPKLREKISLSLSAKLQLTMVWHLVGMLIILNVIFFVLMFSYQVRKTSNQMEAIAMALEDHPGQEEMLLWDPDYSLVTYDEMIDQEMVEKNISFSIPWFTGRINLWNFNVFLPNEFELSDLNEVYYAYSLEDGRFILYPTEIFFSYLFPQTAILFICSLFFILNSTIFFHKKVKKALQPIDVLTKRLHEVGGYDMNVRLSTSGTQREFVDLTFEINELLDRIQKAYSEQTQFVSDASHELRTPIAVIQGYADLLSRWGKDDPETLDESIEAIRGETRAMNLLVEQLLFLARGDNKSSKINMEAVNISEVVEEVYQEAQMVDKSHTFILRNEENCWIYADEAMIKQLMRIFLDNAIKYTPEEGQIIFQVSKKRGLVQFYVEDEGLGISEEELPRVFDRFYRVDKTRNRKAGGTGLGLSIAQQILEIHGAQIEVTSRVGIGTRFAVTMPEWVISKTVL